MLAAVVLAVAAAVLVTAFGTRPAGAAFLGENGKIVYEALDLKTFNYEIFVLNPDGTVKTRLTYNAAEDRMPDVSPNGTKIAFASNRDGAGPLINSIYVMGIDSSDLTRPTKDSGTSDFYPSWSPQGATPNRCAISS